MKFAQETLYRFVFKNGYTHDFWFTKLTAEWRTGDLDLISVKWAQLTGKGHATPFHFAPRDVMAIIDMGKTRSRLKWGE